VSVYYLSHPNGWMKYQAPPAAPLVTKAPAIADKVGKGKSRALFL
jgi:hypothetical protein